MMLPGVALEYCQLKRSAEDFYHSNRSRLILIVMQLCPGVTRDVVRRVKQPKGQCLPNPSTGRLREAIIPAREAFKTSISKEESW